MAPPHFVRRALVMMSVLILTGCPGGKGGGDQSENQCHGQNDYPHPLASSIITFNPGDRKELDLSQLFSLHRPLTSVEWNQPDGIEIERNGPTKLKATSFWTKGTAQKSTLEITVKDKCGEGKLTLQIIQGPSAHVVEALRNAMKAIQQLGHGADPSAGSQIAPERGVKLIGRVPAAAESLAGSPDESPAVPLEEMGLRHEERL